MKGYAIGTELYIFPQEANTFEVGEDVTKIYIQHEQLKAFKAANETIADLMVGYNYNVMTCLPKAWAGHTNDDYEAGSDIEITGYTFTLTGNNIEGKLGVKFDGVDQEMLYEWTDVAPGTMITIYNTVGASDDYETELPEDSDGNWYVEMPEDDLTVTVNYKYGGGESGGGES